MENSDSCTQKRKVARKLKPGQMPNYSQWSLVDWMLARLPLKRTDNIDAVFVEVVANWKAHPGCSCIPRQVTPEDRRGLIDILVGASIRADGDYFTRAGVEHYKGSRVLQGWFVQDFKMPGRRDVQLRALAT